MRVEGPNHALIVITQIVLVGKHVIIMIVLRLGRDIIMISVTLKT